MKERIVRIGKFLKRNVYYVLLIACILAVGTMITLTAINSEPSDDIVIEAPDNTDKPNETPGEDPNDKPSEEDPSVDAGSTPVVFIAPVEGDIVGAYSHNELVYSSTLKQWQTHSGVDYACEEGASVVAVYGGVVYSVENDLLDGVVVTIDHGNGLKTKYGALSESSVKEGDKVSSGDEIGKAGNTALGEVNIGSHLHFETLLDGESVNPAQYSSENK